MPKPARFKSDRSEIAFISIHVFALELSYFHSAISQKEYFLLHVHVVVPKQARLKIDRAKFAVTFVHV